PAEVGLGEVAALERAARQVCAGEGHRLQLAAHELGLGEAAALEAPGREVQLPEAAEARVAVRELRLWDDRAPAQGAEPNAREATRLELDGLEHGVSEVEERQLA